MIDPTEESAGWGAAVARVIPGGNRWLKITAHVVCKDVNGQERWAEDVAGVIQIPHGTEIPQFECASVTTEVEKSPGSEPDRGCDE